MTLFPIPRRDDPCGECHLQPSERCDICGAVAPDPVMTRFEQAARHMGCEHLIPWARFRLGRPQARSEKP